MKLQSTALILIAAAWPGFGEAKPEAIDVYVNDRDDTSLLLGPGISLATEIFKKIGVRIHWHAGELRAGQSGFGIRTARHPPQSATSEALAASTLWGVSGMEITVYSDRVRHFLDGHPTLAEAAGGYVLAHELGHAMQGVARHSESGILKERWSHEDFQEMVYHKLAFTAYDVELIHQGLAGRSPVPKLGKR